MQINKDMVPPTLTLLQRLDFNRGTPASGRAGKGLVDKNQGRKSSWSAHA